MIKKIEKGKRYRVLVNEFEFKTGDVVIALETESKAPYCVREKEYNPTKTLWDYEYLDVRAFTKDELEEI